MTIGARFVIAWDFEFFEKWPWHFRNNWGIVLKLHKYNVSIKDEGQGQGIKIKDQGIEFGQNRLKRSLFRFWVFWEFSQNCLTQANFELSSWNFVRECTNTEWYPPVKIWLSRYISKYRIFEIRIIAGLFVTRLVTEDVWRFYNGSQPIRDINFDSCRVSKLGALGACDLYSYKQYFDGRIFRTENYRGHLFSRASDLLLILLLLHHHRCKELYIISWFFHLCSVIPYYFIRLKKLCEEIANALRINCKTKVRFIEYFEYLLMESKSEKSTIWTMIRELIR